MKKRILVIDDEIHVSKMIYSILEPKGYEVEVANNGSEGLTILKNKDIDLVICDIKMPIMDGYELADRMKEDPELMTIPIIFLTGKTSEEDQILGRIKGADDYITKPFDTRLLLGVVKARLKWADRYRSMSAVKEVKIPDNTIETLARSFYKESSTYGFKQADYLRFFNFLFDIAMRKDVDTKSKLQEKPKTLNFDFNNPNPKIESLPLIGERVKIRAFEINEDKPLFKTWLADEYGRYFLLSRISAKTMDSDKFLENNSSILGVITLHDDTPVGSVAFLNVDHEQKKAELRKLIGEPKMRGKGLAKEACRLWIQYGLTTLELKKIYLNTIDTNFRNIKLNEELGFKVEGILRNEVFFDGEYHDVLRMGLWKG